VAATTTTPVYKATDLILVTRLGHTFTASRRTVAWLDFIIAAFAKRFPDAKLLMLQSCYHEGVAASEGTHDFDACFDFWFIGTLKVGLSQLQSGLLLQRFFRARGGGGWFRHLGEWAAPKDWHVHVFVLPAGLKMFATKVGLYIDGGLSQFGVVKASSQLSDYLRRSLGLKGMHESGADTTWFPPIIRLTVFNYRRWVRLHGVPKGIGEK
jgi:hypothetical protein